MRITNDNQTNFSSVLKYRLNFQDAVNLSKKYITYTKNYSQKPVIAYYNTAAFYSKNNDYVADLYIFTGDNAVDFNNGYLKLKRGLFSRFNAHDFDKRKLFDNDAKFVFSRSFKELNLFKKFMELSKNDTNL